MCFQLTMGVGHHHCYLPNLRKEEEEEEEDNVMRAYSKKSRRRRGGGGGGGGGRRAGGGGGEPPRRGSQVGAVSSANAKIPICFYSGILRLYV